MVQQEGNLLPHILSVCVIPSCQGTDGEKLAGAAALATALELLRVVAVALSPVTPSLSVKILTQLGFRDTDIQVRFYPRAEGFGGLSDDAQEQRCSHNHKPHLNRLPCQGMTMPRRPGIASVRHNLPSLEGQLAASGTSASTCA